MDDLKRLVLHGTALAHCLHCDTFRVDGVWPEQAGKRARRHSRDTGHVTQVRYEHTTEYQPTPDDDSGAEFD